MPDLGAFADLAAVVDEAGLVSEIIGHEVPSG
jgi:hypothetical protein